MNNLTTLKLIVFAGIVVLLALLNIESPFIPIGIIVLIIIMLYAVKNIRTAILILLATKPIIDTTYAFQILPGLSLLQITGVLFPLIVVLYLFQPGSSDRSVKLRSFFYFFMASNLISFMLGFAQSGEFGYFFASLVTFFQISNLVAIYFLLPQLISSDKQLKTFLHVLILAGLFPIITGILQTVNLLPELKTLRTTGELIRISGWYYDSSNLRFYAFQTLIVTVFYLLRYQPNLKFTHRVYLLTYSFSALFIMYKTYSKSALAIIVFGFIVYVLLTKRFIIGFACTLIFTVAWGSSDFIRQDTERLLWKEVKYVDNPDNESFNTNSLLSGRIGMWGNLMEIYSKSDILDQIFGVNYSFGRRAHNDFIRMLYTTGIIGLGSYAMILSAMLFLLLKSYWEYGDALSIFSIIVFSALVIDSVGLTMTLQPAYCWFSFGIMSLSINRGNALSDIRSIPEQSGVRLNLQTKVSAF